VGPVAPAEVAPVETWVAGPVVLAVAPDQAGPDQVAPKAASAGAAALQGAGKGASGHSVRAGPSDARVRSVHDDAVMVGMIGRP